MTATTALKKQVVQRLLELRANFGGNDAQFAKMHGINPTSYSTIKNGNVDGNILRELKWLQLAQDLRINEDKAAWKIVRTEVYASIEDDVRFCQAYAKSLMLVDEPEIGKTVAGRHLSTILKNCFYLDCSQATTKIEFIREFCRVLGIDASGTFANMKRSVKDQLRALKTPIVILDEAGDLSYTAFLVLKEMWNATEGTCGWYMMGADGLRTMIERGMSNKKVGFREMFSRYNGKYMSVVPTDRTQRQQFYAKLITDVIRPNAPQGENIQSLVTKCLASDANGEIGGLRRAQTLIYLNQRDNEAA